MAEQKAPWAVREVKAHDVPPARASAWIELWHDVRLRLERTTHGTALEYAFHDKQTAASAANSLTQMRKRWGLEFGVLQRGVRVYVTPQRARQTKRSKE